MEFSVLLQSILKHISDTTGTEQNRITSAQFLAGILDVLAGKTDVKVGPEESEKMRAVLRKAIPFDKEPFEETRRSVGTHSKEANASAEQERKQFSLCCTQSRFYADLSLRKEIQPEDVLRAVFDYPDDFIKSYLEKGKATAGPDWLSALAGGDLNKIFEKSLDEESPVSQNKSEDGNVSSGLKEIMEEVLAIRDRLDGTVFGQGHAIAAVAKGYFEAQLHELEGDSRPLPAATFLFSGPPGVGKTMLADRFAENVKDKYAYRKFDMATAGSSFPSDLLSFVSSQPRCILLFDEIEKAPAPLIRFFLSILDQGAVNTGRGKSVSFRQAILFFTTNLGKELYEGKEGYDLSAVSESVILNAMQKETDPYTRKPYFPPELCSRFSSGSVVMFNHLSAHTLREIIESEVGKEAEFFRSSRGFDVAVDPDVYTALLLSEGGMIDARALRGHCKKFLSAELYELLRLVHSDEHRGEVETLKSVRLSVRLPENGEIRSLFRNERKLSVLICAPEEMRNRCAESDETVMVAAEDEESAKKVMRNTDVSFALIGFPPRSRKEDAFVNIEDDESSARDVFWFLRTKHPDLPLYILESGDHPLSHEEKKSYLQQGVRGFVSADGENSFSRDIGRLCTEMHQQAGLVRLGRSNHRVTFETGQRVSADGTSAEIVLFDFELETAVDAGDQQNIMSSVSAPDVKFDDIIGAENAKEELRFFIEYLKNPKKFMGTGLKAPRGALLYGPPGTGKTMLAKAVASASGVTFISAAGNQFLKKYVGEGKDNLQQLFRIARKYAPSIVFIDECESFTRERGKSDQPWASGEEVLDALLVEMDGVQENTAKPVFVLCATNFDVTPGSPKSLDPALLRRFDSKIFVDLPNKEERIKFIRKKLASTEAFEVSDAEVESIALRSAGMNLADLNSVMDLSLRMAFRSDGLKVTDALLDEAFETFHGGEEKTPDASHLEHTAYHEAGHAFLSWQSGETPAYVTIISRSGHLGYMQQSEEEKTGYTRDELLAKIRVALGGRAAETVVYGEKEGTSTGASADLAQATQLAKRMICSFGMSEKLGPAVIDPADLEGELAAAVREEINNILRSEMQNAVDLIRANRASLDRLVQRLLSANHLGRDEIRAVFEADAESGKE